MRRISGLFKKSILDMYDPNCRVCKEEIAKLETGDIKKITFLADYNSAGHLTHYHIEVELKEVSNL